MYVLDPLLLWDLRAPFVLVHLLQKTIRPPTPSQIIQI